MLEVPNSTVPPPDAIFHLRPVLRVADFDGDRTDNTNRDSFTAEGGDGCHSMVPLRHDELVLRVVSKKHPSDITVRFGASLIAISLNRLENVHEPVTLNTSFSVGDRPELVEAFFDSHVRVPFPLIFCLRRLC